MLEDYSFLLEKDSVTYEESKQLGKQDAVMINDCYVQMLKRSILNNDRLNVYPLVINKTTNHILDRHHELKAFQELIEEGKIPADREFPAKFLEMSEREEYDYTVEEWNLIEKILF